MDGKRRDFLGKILPGALAAPLLTRLAGASARSWTQEQSRPQTPFPAELPQPEIAKENARLTLQHNRDQIQQDVKKLFALAQELKEQVDKTDSSKVLSLPLVQKAEEIEKLARQIKNLARG